MTERSAFFAERAARNLDAGESPSYFEEIALLDPSFVRQVASRVATRQGLTLLSHSLSAFKVLNSTVAAIKERGRETESWERTLPEPPRDPKTHLSALSLAPSGNAGSLTEEDSVRIIEVGRLHRDFWEAVRRRPDLLREISPRKFEIAMYELLGKLGWEDLELTPGSRDGGLDILAKREIDGLRVHFGFECKRYSPRQLIGPGILRSLLGSLAARQIPKGAVLTTSYFSKDAIQFLDAHLALEGRNFDDLVTWVDWALGKNRRGATGLIRPETRADHAGIRTVLETAFEAPGEARLVDTLRQQAKPLVSLVAELDDRVVGFILFSPVTFADHPELEIMGLAPMAVLPSHQRTGIGSALVRAGLAECERLAISAVVVLGHPEYYLRFGFQPASRFGLGCEYDVPDEVFMALELQPGCLAEVSGTVRYHAAFREL